MPHSHSPHAAPNNASSRTNCKRRRQWTEATLSDDQRRSTSPSCGIIIRAHRKNVTTTSAPIRIKSLAPSDKKYLGCFEKNLYLHLRYFLLSSARNDIRFNQSLREETSALLRRYSTLLPRSNRSYHNGAVKLPNIFSAGTSVPEALCWTGDICTRREFWQI